MLEKYKLNEIELEEKIENSLDELEKSLLIDIIESTIEEGSISTAIILKKYNLGFTHVNNIVNFICEIGLAESDQSFKPKTYTITVEEWKKEKNTLKQRLNVSEEKVEENIKEYKEVIHPYKKLEESEDPLLVKVVDALIGDGIVNKGLIVKEFNPSYNRAEKIMEQLEARKIVSEKLNYQGDRKFLISEDEWLSNKGSIVE